MALFKALKLEQNPCRNAIIGSVAMRAGYSYSIINK